MSQNDNLPTVLAKGAVDMIVGIKVHNAVEDLVESNTSLNPDRLAVQVAIWSASTVVSAAIAPVTDKAVDLAISQGKSLFRRIKKTNEETPAS